MDCLERLVSEMTCYVPSGTLNLHTHSCYHAQFLEIEQFSYFDILAWNCLFTPTFRGFWGIFSSNDVIYRCNPQKALPWAETRHLSHKKSKNENENWCNDSTWAHDREKRKGQDRTVKKVTKALGLYFTYLGRSSHWTGFHKNLHNSCRPRHNLHVCKFLSWNFQGLRFYRWWNFQFSYWFFHGPYNSAALLGCLWYSLL